MRAVRYNSMMMKPPGVVTTRFVLLLLLTCCCNAQHARRFAPTICDVGGHAAAAARASAAAPAQRRAGRRLGAWIGARDARDPSHRSERADGKASFSPGRYSAAAGDLLRLDGGKPDSDGQVPRAVARALGRHNLLRGGAGARADAAARTGVHGERDGRGAQRRWLGDCPETVP